MGIHRDRQAIDSLIDKYFEWLSKTDDIESAKKEKERERAIARMKDQAKRLGIKISIEQ